MIGIIDYGLGNIQAFLNIYKKLHIEARSIKNIEDLKEVDRLILPGVGHFDHAMKSFNNSGMREKVEEMVNQQMIPILGVCVGMQMMADASEEGNELGLGWISGKVKKLSEISQNRPLPHMGWNNINPKLPNSLFENTSLDELSFYFLHSYYYECALSENSIAEVNYGPNFCCVINKYNIFGVQFHPEKSHHYGVNLLHNFSKI